MGIINKCYYTTHKYICIHVCEGTGLCECLCAWLCFCTCVGAYIYLFMILFMKWNTKFSFWITWYITLIMIFVLGYANQPSAFYKTTRCHQEDAGNDNFVISFLYFHFRWIRYCFMRLLDIDYSEGTCIFYISKKFMNLTCFFLFL